MTDALVALGDSVAAFAVLAWRWFIGAHNFWSAFFATGFGALVAFEVERRHRNRERERAERGKANRLIATLGNMVWILEDLKQSLFDERDKQLGRAAEWHEIDDLPGAPSTGPELVFGEFDFLLETDDPDDRAPQTLGLISVAERRMSIALALVAERTTLYGRFAEARAAATHALGVEGTAQHAIAEALGAQIADITSGLRDALPEAIDTFKRVIPALRELLERRYPGKQFIKMLPTDPAIPPL